MSPRFVQPAGPLPRRGPALLLALAVALCAAAGAARLGSRLPSAAVSGLPLDRRSLQEMRATLGLRAHVHLTEHFVILSTTPRPASEPLAATLEAVYAEHALFAQRCGLPLAAPAAKLEVFYFERFEDYRAHQAARGWVDPHTLGFFSRRENRAAFFDLRSAPQYVEQFALLAAALARDDSDRQLGAAVAQLAERVIRHEAAHQVQFNTGILPRLEAPQWLAEGLAALFETPLRPDGGPGENPVRQLEVRQAHGRAPLSAARLEELIRGAPLAADAAQVAGGPAAVLRASAAPLSAEGYALAWALTGWLAESHAPALGRYLRDPGPPHGALAVEHFVAHFGAIDAKLAEDVLAFATSPDRE